MGVMRKSVIVKDNVVLTEIGNITGPILTPTKMPIEDIKKMVVKNRSVFECNVKDPSQQVRLGLGNLYTDNFAVGGDDGEPENPQSPDPQPQVQQPTNNNDQNYQQEVLYPTNNVDAIPQQQAETNTEPELTSGDDGEPENPQSPDPQPQVQQPTNNNNQNYQQNYQGKNKSNKRNK